MGFEEKFDAKSDQASGEIKETLGKVTDNEQLEAEGKGENAAGKGKEFIADAKEAISDGIDSIKAKFTK